MSDVIQELKGFLKKEKFTSSEWERRGLNPSSPEQCHKMADLINKCCERLIVHCANNKATSILKKELKAGIASFNKSEYDTEEKEFIGHHFLELGGIVDIDFNDDLDKWLYGSFMNGILKLTSALKGKIKKVEPLSQNCTNCEVKLETFVTKRQAGITNYPFYIVRCNACGEYNMIDHGPNVHSIRFGEYELVDQLPNSEYNEEQARIRLEQLKHWRKH